MPLTQQTIFEDNKLKSNLLAPFLFVFSIAGLFFGILYYIIGFNIVAYSMLVTSLLAIFLQFIIKKSWYKFSVTQTSHLSITLFYLLEISIAHQTGGLRSPAGLWLLIIIIIAPLMLPKRGALTWIILTVLSIISLAIAEILYPNFYHSSYIRVPHLFLDVTIVSLFIMAAIVTYITDHIIRKINRENSFITQQLELHGILNSLGEMASRMAHEINNPLQIIYGQTILIKNHLPAAQQNNLEKIHNNVFKIKEIIDGLKALSRDGTFDKIVTLSINQHLQTIIQILSHSLKDKEINLKMELIPNAEVLFREVQLGQVFTNLITNAIDYLYNQFPAEQRWLHISMQEENKYFFIAFENNGEPFTSEQIIKIFTPFYTTKEVGKGTGLGLSISKSIVEKNGGQLFVDETKDHPCFIIKVQKS